MEETIKTLFVSQVREHLNGLSAKARIRELIYAYFAPQCMQYGIDEDEFYKRILRPAFRDAAPPPDDDPDPQNPKNTEIKVFGESIHSLKRLGTVLFEEPARDRIYLEDVTFLKVHVDALENADTAIFYTELYRSEKDPEKRYLKICYQLNPALPYRISGGLYADLPELLSAAFKDRTLMNQVYQDYGHGKLHIWLHTREPEQYPALPEAKTVLAFLTFIYVCDKSYPFWIEQELFKTPEELVLKARHDLSFWYKLLKYYSNGQLLVWFDALGHGDWRPKLQTELDDIQQDTLFTEEEKAYALIQRLLYIIEPETVRPMINYAPVQIEELSIPVTGRKEIVVSLDLKTPGFVKARVELQGNVPGITIEQQEFFLFDLLGQTQDIIKLQIDPLQLEKNLLHECVLQITSTEGAIRIPIRVKTIFPIQEFAVRIGKYALSGALFLGFFRWSLSALTGYNGSLPARIITTAIGRSLPDNYPAFFWVFVAMLTSLILSVVLIAKKEKI